MEISGNANAIGAMTGPRVQAAIAAAGGRVLICGGLDADGNVLATAELYDFRIGVSVAVGDMTVPRYGHAAVFLTDGRVLISGGQTTGGGYLASCEYFYPGVGIPNSGRFVAGLTGLTVARAGHCAVRDQNVLVLIAGGSAPAGTVAGAEFTFSAGGTIQLQNGDLPTPNVSSVVVKSLTGQVYVSGADYSVDDATGVVSLLEGGAIPAEASVIIGYDYAALPSIALTEQYLPATAAEMAGVLPGG